MTGAQGVPAARRGCSERASRAQVRVAGAVAKRGRWCAVSGKGGCRGCATTGANAARLRPKAALPGAAEGGKLGGKLPGEPSMSDHPPVTRRLANGAELRAQQQPWAQQVGFCLRVAAGSHDEPAAYPGLAHFLEHLLFLGSRNYPRDQGLMAFVQLHGGQVNASTQARHTDFICELPAEHLQAALTHLLDMLCRPLLDSEAQLREREVLHAEYQARSQDGSSRIDHALGDRKRVVEGKGGAHEAR